MVSRLQIRYLPGIYLLADAIIIEVSEKSVIFNCTNYISDRQMSFENAVEVAAFLQLPRSIVYKLAQDKVIPGFKIGKHWRFRKDTFHEWLKKQESQNAEPGKLEH